MTTETVSRPMTSRTHRIVPHTADVGIEIGAADPGSLFEEAAVAVASIAADIEGNPPAATWDCVTLEASDLPALAYAWLNEIIGLSDIHRGALVAACVDRLTLEPSTDGRACWTLRARVGFRSFGGRDVRPHCQVKAATFHELAVRQDGDVWTLTAYLDI